MNLRTLRIGGVPEHFNYPWIKAIENDLFSTQNIQLVWSNFPGGTGAMAQALKNDEIDLALLLTEGAVKEIANGAPFKIVTTYVETPLIWGVHSASANLKKADISTYRFAISRFGSGSHLMAYVYSNDKKIKISDGKMVVVGDITGARQALSNEEAELFLWEKFMTKPLVDSGEFHLFDEIPTPWPCFMLVSNSNYYQENKSLIKNVLDIFYPYLAEFLNIKTLINEISEYYKLKEEDVKVWLSKTKWALDYKIDQVELEKVSDTLYKLDILKIKPDIEGLFFKFDS
ncbi:MAG: ABC transporter substrate-binding protein [Opitutaceae bacterium]|nr:ABC transporter substrate-binding protein [Cytophagales bacterium]